MPRNPTGYSDTLDERIKPGSTMQAVTLNDSADLTFIDTEEATTKFCRGFHVNVSGTLSVIPAQGSTAVLLVVAIGNYYPYSIARFRVTGTVTIGNGDIIAIR